MDEILTVEEVAAYLKVSKVTVRCWCLKARLPAFKIEREWRIYKKDLDHMIRHASCGPDNTNKQARALKPATAKGNIAFQATIDM